MRRSCSCPSKVCRRYFHHGSCRRGRQRQLPSGVSPVQGSYYAGFLRRAGHRRGCYQVRRRLGYSRSDGSTPCSGSHSGYCRWRGSPYMVAAISAAFFSADPLRHRALDPASARLTLRYRSRLWSLRSSGFLLLDCRAHAGRASSLRSSFLAVGSRYASFPSR